jgi:cob(I)alamin adenosyltransferase
MTTKEQVLDRAITDIQNEIMYAWKSVMNYEQQLSDMSMDEENKKMLRLLIENEKSKVETKSAILDKITPTEPALSEVENAKDVLRAAGYHVPALWHLRDVTDKYECDEDTAWHILHEVIDKSIWRINESIDEMAQEHELKSKEQ